MKMSSCFITEESYGNISVITATISYGVRPLIFDNGGFVPIQLVC